MASWNSQQFREGALREGRQPHVIGSALQHAANIRAVNPNLFVVFTLGHLAHLSGVPTFFLRSIASRKVDPYRTFLLRKRGAPKGGAPARRYRTICVPTPQLCLVQRWIHDNILIHAPQSAASCAYGRGNTLFEAARRHRNARWLLKVDIHRFFESITEKYVTNIFKRLGYPKLLSFQLARLCTRLPSPPSRRNKFRTAVMYPNGIHTHAIAGFLPQGAPTSPLLANLTMVGFDEAITSAARNHDLRYSRYADDLIFSTPGQFTRDRAKAFIREVYQVLVEFGFEANRTKTAISPPGSRKIALGLLVDSDEPRLTRQFKEKILTHVHFICRNDVGPVKHAESRHFASVIGLQNHVFGLLAFASQIDPVFASRMQAKLANVNWSI